MGTALMRTFQRHKASFYFDGNPPEDLRIECGNAAIGIGNFDFAAWALEGTSDLQGLQRVGEWYEENNVWHLACAFYRAAKATERIRALGFKLINLSHEKKESEEETDVHAKHCIVIADDCFYFLKDKHECDNIGREMMYRGMYEQALRCFERQNNKRQLQSCAKRMIDRKMLTDDLWRVCKDILKDKPLIYAFAYILLWTEKAGYRPLYLERFFAFRKTVRDYDLEDQVSIEDLERDTTSLLSRVKDDDDPETFAYQIFELIVELNAKRETPPEEQTP